MANEQNLRPSEYHLSQEEAKLRQQSEGKNEIEKAKKFSFFKCFLKQLLNV